MGEKLLAQRIIKALRTTSMRTSRAGSALQEWAFDQREWLWPQLDWSEDPAEDGGELALAPPLIAWDRLPALAEQIETAEEDPALFATTDAVADLLGFDAFDTQVLRIASAMERLSRLATLRTRLYGSGEDLLRLVGALAGGEGGDAVRSVRQSAPIKLGLLFVGSDYNNGGFELGLDWRFIKVLDEGATGSDRLTQLLAGIRQQAALTTEDFVEQAEPVALMARLLAGALKSGAAGVNLLLYGPPGTGKTELSRVLAEAAGAELYAVGEADQDGEEPSRLDRVSALRRAQRLLGRRGGSVLLFDEMEDLFADASLFAGSGGRRTSSKVFVNRLLESNQVPVIWTSNAIDDVDPAHLRRMSFILRMSYPGARARARIVARVARVAQAEGANGAAAGLAPLLGGQDEAAGIARTALRAAALAGGRADDAEAIGRSLLLGLRGGRLPAPQPGGRVEPWPLRERPGSPGARGGHRRGRRAGRRVAAADRAAGHGQDRAGGLSGRADEPAAAGQARVRSAVGLGRRHGGQHRRCLCRGARPECRAAVRRGGFAALRPSGRAALVGGQPGQRAADLDGPAPAAVPGRDQLRAPARSGGAAPVRVQARPAAAVAGGAGAGLRRFFGGDAPAELLGS
jgi:hypothetical protein